MQAKNINWISDLRFVSTVGVVFLHVSATCIQATNSISAEDWWTGNIYNGLFKFSVPIFVMISGALLLSKDYPLKVFLQKRFTRILYPFLFWSLIYCAFMIFREYLLLGTMDILVAAKMVLLGLITGSFYHLWYVYMILGLYLLTPILRGWISVTSRATILYFLAICFLVSFRIFPEVAPYFPRVELSYFAGFIGFYVAGYYFHTFDISVSPLKLWLIFLLITATTMVATYNSSYESGKLNEFYYAYQSPLIITSSVCIFLAFKSVNWQNRTFRKLIDAVNENSFGIYLSHALFIILLSQVNFNWKMVNPAIGIFIVTVVTLILAYSITWFIRKLPLGKYISG
ncbi:MAG TPA: acyltransferase family protein [Flavobacterium sp.]|jgi:surface polysaccharide O-acyltransferase-like enzyme